MPAFGSASQAADADRGAHRAHRGVGALLRALAHRVRARGVEAPWAVEAVPDLRHGDDCDQVTPDPRADALRELAEDFPHGVARLTLGPTAAEFVRSRSRRILLRAGNRTSKTYSGAIKTWDAACGGPSRTIIVLCSSHSSKVAVVGKQLHDLAPRKMLVNSDYNARRGWRNDLIELDNGSKIIFRSDLSSPQSIDGIEAYACWFDEPCDSEMLDALMSRVAVQQGQIWGTMTPIGRAVQHLKMRVEGEPAEDVPPTEDWAQYVIPLTPEECPWRTPESIEAQVAGYSPWVRAQRAEGAWDGLTGDRLLEGFDEQTLIRKIPARNWQVRLGLDHGIRAGSEVCVLLLWDPAQPLMIALDEYVNATTSDPDADAIGITGMLARHNIRPRDVDHAVGDVNSAGKSQAGRSVNQVLGDALGIRIAQATKGAGSIERGVSVLNTAMRRGHFRVHPRCRSLTKSMRHWQGKDDDLKHVIDGLRYGATDVLERAYRPEQPRLVLP